MREKEFQQRVVDYARTLNWAAYHTHDSRRSEPGFPDLVLVRGPRLVFAELKTEIGSTTADQERWLDALCKVEGRPEVFVWRPSEWESEIMEVLR